MIIELSDGYNGHMAKFDAEPLEINEHSVKLRCVEPGKEYMIGVRSRKEYDAAARAEKRRTALPASAMETGSIEDMLGY